ncbi:MAG TPA: CoA-binding protein [Anaerolineae bacterium]|nr:CoA-binding protein [Anaerolineae bacterium]
MNDSDIKRILATARTIAVVGLSSDPSKPSHDIAHYLQRQGYRIIPVNPTLHEALGETAYPDLISVPDKVDVVQVFRRSEDVPPIVDQAIQIEAQVVWLQEGIRNDDAAKKAEAAGLDVVMDRCMRALHRRLIGEH